MNKNTPLVSIGMPVYNDAKFISQALNSLLNQSYQNIELIISDDGSTDGSDLICHNYACKDPRIHYIRQPINLGIQKNMEFVLKEAKGEFFMWAGDDDLWEKEFISELLTPLQERLRHYLYVLSI